MNNAKNNIVEPGATELMCEDFLLRAGTEEEAVELCRQLLRNMERGDTCLCLDETQAELIRKCPVVSVAPESNGLLILDKGRLFTRRNWTYEQNVRTKLADLTKKIAENIVIPDDPVFDKLHNCQREAVKMMVENRFSILTGGPGTGKTYTIARAVKLALMNGSLRIGLAAPTGKAAARVNETMEQEIQTLDLSGVEKAVTIHSLLGATYTGVSFEHGRNNPLELDWVIIDESSMVDLPLMAKLLNALPAECRLTLVGDAYQLASVEPGRVFSDLCHLPDIPICELTQSSRFPEGGTIDLFAKAVNSGKGDDVLKILETENELLHYSEFTGPEQSSPRFWPDFEEMILQHFSDFAKQTDPLEALKRLNQSRILCAMHQGTYGTETLNRYMNHLLSGRYPSCPVPVMITRNDKILGVSNGDVGVKMQTDNRLYLLVPGSNEVRSIPMELLPETETAFASTIHKAQGSEYSDVVIVLPSDHAFSLYQQGRSLFTRELLYTAITRTKNEIFLYAGKQSVLKCCATRIFRQTGLQ